MAAIESSSSFFFINFRVSRYAVDIHQMKLKVHIHEKSRKVIALTIDRTKDLTVTHVAVAIRTHDTLWLPEVWLIN